MKKEKLRRKRFRGRFEYTIDSKGRISIPTKFREVLRDEYNDMMMIITNMPECLVAYPYEEWERLEENIVGLPPLSQDVRAFKRYYISGARECSPDRQGRILIPPELRSHAGLKKDVVLAGALNYFEIWSKERWQSEIEDNVENFESILREVTELGL